MNAIEKIISQMNEAAEQERAALEQEESLDILYKAAEKKIILNSLIVYQKTSLTSNRFIA